MLLQQFNIENSKSWRNITQVSGNYPLKKLKFMLLFFQGGGGGPLKLGITETCERIKEEFNFIQNQYHS